MTELARPGFVLDQHRGGAGAGVRADRALHREGVAIAGVAIRQPQNLWRGADDRFDGVVHLGECQQIHVRHREPHRRDTGTGGEPGGESGLLDQAGAQTVAATGHDLKAGLIEQGFHGFGLGTHQGSSLGGSSRGSVIDHGVA
jgi:hypothetical protein